MNLRKSIGPCQALDSELGSRYCAFVVRDSNGGMHTFKPLRANGYGFYLLNIPNHSDPTNNALQQGIPNASNAVEHTQRSSLSTSEPGPLFGSEANCPRNEFHR